MKLPEGRGPLSEINVTPLVDVFLVLLVIFMITAPVLRQAIEVGLPSAQSAVSAPTDGLSIRLARDGRLSVEGRDLEIEHLPRYLQDWRQGLAGEKAPVYIEADEQSPYGRVIRVLDEVRAAGIVDVGMVTRQADPARERREER